MIRCRTIKRTSGAPILAVSCIIQGSWAARERARFLASGVWPVVTGVGHTESAGLKDNVAEDFRADDISAGRNALRGSVASSSSSRLRLRVGAYSARARRADSLCASLTAFVRRTLKLDDGGRTIRSVKEQLNRLSSADFRLGVSDIISGRSVTFKSTVIEGFELWAPRDMNQKVLWPTIIQFSHAYFESLMEHAIPLNEQAVARLGHNAMALDIYTWLAQRLHRINPKRVAFVPWVSLKEQFGHGYSAMNNFKRVFRKTLKQVQVVYQDARFGEDGKGLRLLNSRPPVLPRTLRVK